MTTQYPFGPGRRLCVLAFITAIGIGQPLSAGEEHSLTVQEQAAIRKAISTAEQSLTAHSSALESAIRSRKDGSTAVADRLTGYKAAWVLFRHGEEELERYAREVIDTGLISVTWCSELVGNEVGKFITELRDTEDALARATHRPSLSSSTPGGHTGMAVTLNPQGLELAEHRRVAGRFLDDDNNPCFPFGDTLDWLRFLRAFACRGGLLDF